MISSAKVTVSCDQKLCDYKEDFFLEYNIAHGWQDDHVKEALKEAGWLEIDENKHICPNCQEEDDS